MNRNMFIQLGERRLKVLLFCLFMLFITGCGLTLRRAEAIPDQRTGPNLIIFFAENGDTRRTAQAIAQKTGGDLFDLGGKKPLPDLLRFDTFFVGGSLKEGRIAPPLIDFLKRTDFIDGRVIPFWTGREEADMSPDGDLNGEFEKRIRGGRFLRGGGFRFDRWVKAKEINGMVEAWVEAPLAELELRQAAGGDQAEDMAKLFSAVYRERLGPAVFEDGDWTFELDGTPWYYAQGKFLPQEDADRPQEFLPQFLYRYSLEPSGSSEELNPWQQVADAIFSRRFSFGSYGSRLYPNPGAVRSPFYETLWQARSREEAFSQQQWITFLGRQVQIHRGITDPLNRAEARIVALAETDPEIQGWIKNLQSITGWNWRNVAGSENRSFHSYGIAVDLLMKAEPGMETYWQWTAAKGIDWRSVPIENRQNPPGAVIRVFEEQGFIWGGRWPRYDTMHFEYHPELLILGTGRKPEGTA
ncbi:MAG: M15 family metallopeptidase [Treponema sp.]|jgi:flavodoxin|nr:M15 family metallopeptidase [Treponema sp.]